MPPWGAVKGVGEFANDSSLSEPEIEMLMSWVEGGAPEGDPAYLLRVPPPVLVAKPVRFSRRLQVQTQWRVAASASLAALETRHPTEAGSRRADGTVDRLLWTKAEGKREYVLKEAVALRAGDIVHLTGPTVLCFR